MTPGNMLFISGAALLGLTVILAIIFLIKKPKYTPESAAYDDMAPGRTQRLLNGYPTDRMTIRRDSPRPLDPEETELLLDDQTELVSGTGASGTEQIDP